MEAYLPILLLIVICEIALLFFVYKKISIEKEKRKRLEEEQRIKELGTRETVCFPPAAGEAKPPILEEKVNSLIRENPESAALFIRKLIADDSIKKGNKNEPKEFSSLEKSAYILRLLDSDLSAEVFKHLREDEIITLTSEITRLGLLDAKEQIPILREFKDHMEKKP